MPQVSLELLAQADAMETEQHSLTETLTSERSAREAAEAHLMDQQKMHEADYSRQAKAGEEEEEEKARCGGWLSCCFGST